MMHLWSDPTSRQKRLAVAALAIVVVAGSSLAVLRQYPEEEIGGRTWRQMLACDFREAWCPAGWGWGTWRLTPDGLLGEAPADSFAVYFFGRPVRSRGAGTHEEVVASMIGNSDKLCDHFRHGGDFVMETEVRLLRAAPERSTEAQLLIRDGNGVIDETGIAMIAGQQGAIVRYRVDGIDYILRSWPVAESIATGRWYQLRFTAYQGHIRVDIDRVRVFDSSVDSLPAKLRAWMDSTGGEEPRLPPGHFIEPHLAVKSGAAEFRSTRLFVRPDDRAAFLR